jgi:RNA polymerase sigma-70 factor, ECF subfamily
MRSVTQSSAPSLSPGCLDDSFSRFRQGASEELGRLLEEFRPYLLAIANAEFPRRLAGKMGPSDLVQLTIIKGHERMADFRGAKPEELACWLRQILLNHLKTATRSFACEKRELSREQPAARSMTDSRQLSPSGVAVSREEREVLDRALERLPDPYRQAIEMRHVQNLSFHEIGQRLNRSQEAARKLWARAVRQLQRELEIDAT